MFRPMEIKRIAFLDYLRIFACFLVMLVHASENFYGASSGEMAGPVSMLADATDRLLGFRSTTAFHACLSPCS